MQSKFRCPGARTKIEEGNVPLKHHFHEFHVNTGPDLDDLMDIFETDNQGGGGNDNMPGLLTDSESEYSSGSDDEEEWDDEEDEEDWLDEEDYLDSTEMAAEGTSQINVDIDSTSAPIHGPPDNVRPGKEREAPQLADAEGARKDLQKLLKPPRKTGPGYTDPGLDHFVRSRMEGMLSFLNLYTNPHSKTYKSWGASSLQAAITMSRGRYCARQLRRLTRQFIKDRTVLPVNPYGQWNESMLVDEDLANDINLYLQEIGKEISARKLMEYLAQDEVKARHGITKPISERTARRYLNSLGYRFTAPKKGQYADGHEREDVVYYRQQQFLPEWRRIQNRMECWVTADALPEYGPKMPGLRVITWFHNESIFYANDRRKKGWYHKDAPAKPYAKGEGASLMIADFVSADFGWLRSPDGKQSARRIMRPGKAKDGYFSNDDILEQAEEAIRILREFYPQYEHVLIYDNASTHLKRGDGALSARKMPKGTPKAGENWGVEVTKRDPVSGKICYKADGKPEKIKIRMADAHFSDGMPQPLYFPVGHPRAGVFKGMAKILEERGFGDMSKVRAECKGFKCVPPSEIGGTQNCCCRCILYNEPDFTNVKSLLEEQCKILGVLVLFLPKFHCELNFIEQCWGYAKRLYRLCPESSREDQLEKNSLNSLEAIPLDTMRKFATRSCRFMDAYDQGLNGRQAAWATRKYRGHRVIPATIMDELEKEGVV